MAGSIIKAIKGSTCGWDGKKLEAHSHKGLMKCLYKSNVELYREMQRVEALQKDNNNLTGELGRHLSKEQVAKEDTGLMDVKEPPIDLTNTITDEKKLASDLLEAESFIKTAEDVTNDNKG